MKTKLVIRSAMAMASLLAVTSCTDKIEFDQPSPAMEGGPILLSSSILQEYESRANDDGFAEGDRMGVYIVDYQSQGAPGTLTLSSNRASNAPFTFDGGTKWTTPTAYYWKDTTTPIDVYGYYPYSTSINDVKGWSFEVSSDQSADGAYEASDFLWSKAAAVAPTSKVIHLKFTHRMAGVMVILTKGDGISDIEWEKVEKLVDIDNTVRNANIDLSNGTVTAYGKADKYIRMADQGDGNYRAVVVPQQIDKDTRLMSITIDGTSYAYTRTESLTFTAGKLHRFTMKIDKKEGGDYAVSLVSEEITPWENDKVSHNFFESEYVVVNVTEAGTLKASIEAIGKDYSRIRNLKVTGPITNSDFEFMRDEMSELTMLNLKDATCKDISYQYDWDENYRTETMQNTIPQNAFREKATLRRITLPDNLSRICNHAFFRIGLDVNSSVIIPKHLKRIDEGAFAEIGEAGELVFNDEIEYIGNYSFARSAFRCDFNLPQTLKHIGSLAFGDTGNNSYFMNFSGRFMLPENLEYYGGPDYEGNFDGPFKGISMDCVGDIVVPEVVTSIEDGMFPYFNKGCYVKMHNGIKTIKSLRGRFINHVDIPEGVTTFGREAFYCNEFAGGITLPSSIRTFAEGTFAECRISGDLIINDGVSIIPMRFFERGCAENVTLPSTVQTIEESAFAGCEIKSINIGQYCDVIGPRAFAECEALTKMVCLNPIPPIVINPEDEYNNPFAGINLDHFILEVPEKSVEKYRQAPGWNKLRYITPHHELAVNVAKLNCLDGGLEYETLVRSESTWEVTECPSWCHVTPSSSNDKRTEVVISVDKTSAGNEREGKIVFKLQDNDYTTYTEVHQYGYEYGQDQEIELQNGSKGSNSIPVFIVGEGYDAPSIVDGSYIQAAREVYESLFSIEPFKTYKDYFTVSCGIACSADPGIELAVAFGETGSTALWYKKSTCFDARMDEYGFSINYDMIKDYAITHSSHIDNNNVGKALIVTFTNYQAFIGSTRIDNDGTSMATLCRVEDTYPYDFRGLVQHYAGGAAFGRLAPEFVTHFEFIKGCCCEQCKAVNEYYNGRSKGWYGNVSLTGSMSSVPWSHLIFDPRYSDIVDVYEGAYRHLRGAYRSESQSCMSTYTNYYNTISREIIVKRIKEITGETYSFEDFVSHDHRE